ncbi:MAG: hypothetical protein KF788_17945 [Piscinibacter sp.]|nr:hypothetical protein [Piscinibacter sp.]
MPAVKMSISLAVAGGPVLSVAAVENVEAYDVIEVTIPANTTTARRIQLQPASAANVNLLLIQSDLYGPEISYRASNGTADSDPVALLGPQLFGRGVLSLFGNDVLSLLVVNTHPAPAPGAAGRDAHLQILVGRDATP